jgi:hypothetical protein
LIARQRDNLRRTFVQQQESNPDTRVVQKLATTERELAEATAEFTEGIEERAGPVPCLHEAQDAMKAAIEALGQKDLQAAAGSEETALAGLIQARQNLRKFLAQSSSSASECRKFDKQQKQKIRKPNDEEKKKRLAKLQEEIEELAKQQKKFSQEIASKSGGGAEMEQDPQSGQKQKPSKGQKGSPSSSSSQGSPAERQEKAAEKAEELKNLIREDEAMTDLARERMDQAAEDVQDSASAMRQGREKQAGDKAADAAEQLERLARQVAGLKAADLMTRVAQSESLARQLARQQQGLGKELQQPDPDADVKKAAAAKKRRAEEERRLAEEARTLADLLQKLQKDATGKNAELGRQLREAGEANSPEEAAKQMSRAAAALKAGKPGDARPDVDQSAQSLEALGQHLGEARHGLSGPQLDKLMALEKQAAETQKALESVNNERQKDEAEKKVTDLREALDAMQPGDPKLSEAAAAMRNPASSWKVHGDQRDTHRGAYVPPIEYSGGVAQAVKVLQAKIQEIILRDALLDKDEAVPPQYKTLVEEYYRVLSEDLR